MNPSKSQTKTAKAKTQIYLPGELAPAVEKIQDDYYGISQSELFTEAFKLTLEIAFPRVVEELKLEAVVKKRKIATPAEILQANKNNVMDLMHEGVDPLRQQLEGELSSIKEEFDLLKAEIQKKKIATNSSDILAEALHPLVEQVTKLREEVQQLRDRRLLVQFSNEPPTDHELKESVNSNGTH
ncbi:MAG: hypothetical protein F6K55_03245 [Moorea sp. SIO4A3]|nr:hypothetical protein [Moorena sp. SIO4A3]